MTVGTFRLFYVAASTNIQINGMGRAERERIDRAVTQLLSGRPGKWRVQLLGAMSDTEWEVCISGPALETSGFVDAGQAQKDPGYLASAVEQILSDAS